ncbi:MAG: hypothetical protein SOZ52_07270 [Pyramidobacter sp.]|nr:hypothetical protein [Pyramidobacter sp.]
MFKRIAAVLILLMGCVLQNCSDAFGALGAYEKESVQYSETAALEDSQIRKQFLDEIERSFMKDYALLWMQSDMSSKLADAIDRSLRGKLDESWVMESLQVAMNMNNIVQHVQDTVPLEFAKDYGLFLAQVEENFTDTYLDKLRSFDRALQAVRVGALANAPAVKLFFEEQIRVASEEGHLSLTGGELSASESKQLSLGGTAAFVGVLLGRKFIQKTLARKAISVIGSGLGKKILAAATGVGTVLTLAWAVYDVGSFTVDVWNSPKELKSALLKHYEDHYTVTCPNSFWQVLRKGVRAELNDILERMARRDDDTKAILASSAFREQTADMTPEEQQKYVDMLISVKPLDDSVSYAMIAENFGSVLRQAEKEDVRVIRDILSSGDLLVARQWFALAGMEYCSLYGTIPRQIWDSYHPDAQSLKILRWLALQPKAARENAVKLSQKQLVWAMEELPAGQAARLLGENHSVKEIEDEIARMSTLPRDARVVWQSRARYLLNRAQQYLIYTCAAFASITAALAWLKLRPKKSPAPHNNNQERVLK